MALVQHCKLISKNKFCEFIRETANENFSTMMLERKEKVNKNIQEAKTIVNNIDGIFTYFDTLKDILPQIKGNNESEGEDAEVNEMLASLGLIDKRSAIELKIRRRKLYEKHIR